MVVPATQLSGSLWNLHTCSMPMLRNTWNRAGWVDVHCSRSLHLHTWSLLRNTWNGMGHLSIHWTCFVVGKKTPCEITHRHYLGRYLANLFNLLINYLSISLLIYVFLNLFTHPSTYYITVLLANLWISRVLSSYVFALMHLFVSLFVPLFIYFLCIYPLIHVSMYPCIRAFIYSLIHNYVNHLFVCLPNDQLIYCITYPLVHITNFIQTINRCVYCYDTYVFNMHCVFFVPSLLQFWNERESSFPSFFATPSGFKLISASCATSRL